MSESWPMREGNERSSYVVLERSQNGGGYVYFLGSQDGSRIKIGWSKKDVLERLDDHAEGDAFGHGGNYCILAIVRADRHAETFLKSYFKSHLVAKREVFKAAPLLPYLAWLRDHYFVSLDEVEFYSQSGRTVIDSQAWLPGDGRTSTRRCEPSLLALVDPWSILPSRITTGDDYYTPEHIVACAREALGGTIDCDPASHVMANQIVRARVFYTRDQNGLQQPWHGRVFLNPPFSDWPEWVDKVLHESTTGNVTAMVLLGAVRTLTAQYFEPLLKRADGFCIISGRTPFWGIKTDSDSPTDGHFLLYIGPYIERFVTATAPLGKAWLADAPMVAPMV